METCPECRENTEVEVITSMLMSEYQDKWFNTHFVAQGKVGMSVILQMGTEKTCDLSRVTYWITIRTGSTAWVSLLQISFPFPLGCCEPGVELGWVFKVCYYRSNSYPATNLEALELEGKAYLLWTCIEPEILNTKVGSRQGPRQRNMVSSSSISI